MAQQVSPQLPQSPSIQVAQNNGIPSAIQTPLDLNLSHKASQNPPKVHDEAETAQQKAPESSPNPPQESVTQLISEFTQSNEHEDTKNILEPKTDHQSPITTEKIIVEPGEAVIVVNNGVSQNATTMSKDGAPGVTVSAPASSGRKRKSPRVKQSPPDPNKRVILALGAKDEEGVTKSPKQQVQKMKIQASPLSKNKLLLDSDTLKSNTPLDLAERRLLLDERKIALAEQRFALEEKKLEATIEIGKGLIMSMERMTTTISGLGVPTTYQR